MSASDPDFVPLHQWPPLQRPRALQSLAMAIQFLEDGRIEPALTVIRALHNRLDVDESVEQFWAAHEEKEVCFALHQ